MMMIAFNTINSSFLPLIEGLCPQILYFRFEIIGGLRRGTPGIVTIPQYQVIKQSNTDTHLVPFLP